MSSTAPSTTQPVTTVTAIIPAAGSGSRMNAGIPKPLLEICGKKIIEWTVKEFSESGAINQIVVMAPKEYLAEFEFLKTLYPNIVIVEGGATRQESVKKGLNFIESRVGPDDLILVHDAARCLITKEVILRAIEAAKHHGAVSVAVPMVDSVKVVDDQHFVIQSLDRDKLWAIQTPQVFKAAILLEAHKKNTTGSTDDASLVELHHKVRIVKGERENIKITTPLDLEIAQQLLRKKY